MMAGRPMVVGPVVQGPPMMVPGQPMGQPIMDYKMQVVSRISVIQNLFLLGLIQINEIKKIVIS
jgi:hypothetical protein